MTFVGTPVEFESRGEGFRGWFACICLTGSPLATGPVEILNRPHQSPQYLPLVCRKFCGSPWILCGKFCGQFEMRNFTHEIYCPRPPPPPVCPQNTEECSSKYSSSFHSPSAHKGRGEGEDALAPAGSKRAGWGLKVNTCKYLSSPPAWAFLWRELRFPLPGV